MYSRTKGLDRSKVIQLETINNHLSDKGVFVVDCQTHGVTMGYWNDYLVIFTLKGDMAIHYDMIPDFIRWLKQIDQTGYVPLNMPICFQARKNTVIISNGKLGRLLIFRSRIKSLTEEIEGIYDILRYRKEIKLIGA